jgi:hypothetical protein
VQGLRAWGDARPMRHSRARLLRVVQSADAVHGDGGTPKVRYSTYVIDASAQLRTENEEA